MQAARAAQAASAAQREMDVDDNGPATVELPAFGAGIDFKPSGRQDWRVGAKNSGTAGRAYQGAAAVHLRSSEDVGDDSQVQPSLLLLGFLAYHFGLDLVQVAVASSPSLGFG